MPPAALAPTALDWDDLRYFLAIARSGRLTLAARQLKQDHTTLARRLSALERALGAKLFDRLPQGYRLTEAGTRLLDTAERIESEALRARGVVQSLHRRISGTVRIGTPDGFGTYILAPRIGQLTERHPDLEIDLVAMPRLFSLSRREADLAIGLGRPSEGRLFARRLTDYRLGLYASAEYLDARPAIRDPDDLAHHPLIGYTDDYIFTPELDYIAIFAPKSRVRLRSSSLIAQLRATLAGAGIAVLPSFMAKQEPALRPVLAGELALTRTFWLLTHADTKDIPAVRATADFVAQAVKQARDLFA